MVACHPRLAIASICLSALCHMAWAFTPWPLVDHQNGFRTNGHNINFTATPQPLHLSSLSSAEFTTLTHPAYPANQVRIKRTDGFCDPSVASYAGYLDANHGTRHLFFYFFESRSQPEEDDILMWINGGPGGSSSLGLFSELGPCNIDTNLTSGSNGTIFNPYGWNANANVFFLDQPAGVGYSYDDFDDIVSTTPEAAKDVDAFLRIFFDTFISFRGRNFHMSGESYGGRYIPLFAAEVWDQNQHVIKAGRTPVNLKSILIGNGYTNVVQLHLSMYDQQCTNATLPPVTDIATCIRMKQAVSRCEEALTASCINVFDEMACAASSNFCSTELLIPYISSERNPFDISKTCDDEQWNCYAEGNYIDAFLNRASTQEILGIDDAHKNFSSVNKDVNEYFFRHGDHLHQTQLWVAQLLERGVDVLIYAGTYDFICNWIGNLAWTEAMEWSGKREYNQQDLQPWTVEGKQAGLTKSTRGFTYATVDAAGHMVPYDKPVEALAMFQRWLADRHL